VIYDEIKKRHENFVMDQRISCSGMSADQCIRLRVEDDDKRGRETDAGGFTSISALHESLQ
jgi:hypothetical protein